MYGWVLTIEKIMRTLKLHSLNGSLINIFSDYSGQHKTSKYEVLSALYVDLDASRNWALNQRLLRQKFLPDGRRMAFKSLNDRYRQKALVPFLDAANSIVGLLVTLIINKTINNLCVGKSDFEKAKTSLDLKLQWRVRDLERTLRVTHLIGLLIGGLSRPHQNIYWISDEDSIFANQELTQELSVILGKITGFYVQHELGELGLGTTAIDPGDRFEEDAAAIADLTAGGMAEAANIIATKAGGRIPVTIAFPFGGRFSPKTETISSWVWHSTGDLKKVVILFEKHGRKGYSVSRWDMEV